MHTPVLYKKMSLLSNRKFLSSGTQHNEVTRDWQNVIVFVIMGVHYISQGSFPHFLLLLHYRLENIVRYTGIFLT